MSLVSPDSNQPTDWTTFKQAKAALKVGKAKIKLYKDESKAITIPRKAETFAIAFFQKNDNQMARLKVKKMSFIKNQESTGFFKRVVNKIYGWYLNNRCENLAAEFKKLTEQAQAYKNRAEDALKQSQSPFAVPNSDQAISRPAIISSAMDNMVQSLSLPINEAVTSAAEAEHLGSSLVDGNLSSWQEKVKNLLGGSADYTVSTLSGDPQAVYISYTDGEDNISFRLMQQIDNRWNIDLVLDDQDELVLDDQDELVLGDQDELVLGDQDELVLGDQDEEEVHSFSLDPPTDAQDVEDWFRGFRIRADVLVKKMRSS